MRCWPAQPHTPAVPGARSRGAVASPLQLSPAQSPALVPAAVRPTQGTATLLSGSTGCPQGVFVPGLHRRPRAPLGHQLQARSGREGSCWGLAQLLPVLLPSAAVGCQRVQGAAPAEVQARHPSTGLHSTSSTSPRAAAQCCMRPRACRSGSQPCRLSPRTSSRSLPRGSPKAPRLPQPPAADGAQGHSTAAGKQEPPGELHAPVGVVTLHSCSQAIHRAAGSCQEHEVKVVMDDTWQHAVANEEVTHRQQHPSRKDPSPPALRVQGSKRDRP